MRGGGTTYDVRPNVLLYYSRPQPNKSAQHALPLSGQPVNTHAGPGEDCIRDWVLQGGRRPLSPARLLCSLRPKEPCAKMSVDGCSQREDGDPSSREVAQTGLFLTRWARRKEKGSILLHGPGVTASRCTTTSCRLDEDRAVLCEGSGKSHGYGR